MSDRIRPYAIDIKQAQLQDLQRRLRNTRWPDKETVSDWTQGVPLAYMKELCGYWAEEYDWRSRERRMNAFPQFTTNINGLEIHFLHIRSGNPNATPVLMSHGWPGSIAEFLKVIGPLTDPVAHEGCDEDAFHLVCPSLPGFGFSERPAKTGCGVEKIAEMWDTLMNRLGYDKYLAQGGDWGAAITTVIGLQARGACTGIHVNMPLSTPTEAAKASPSEKDKRAFAAARFYREWESGYSNQQKTRPQTLGYGLVDSPAGQAAWIIEKFRTWTDCDGQPENVISRDELLDNVMLYWLPGTAASSARLYWESFDNSFGGRKGETVLLPTGCSIFPKEIVPTPREWAEQRYSNIVYWNELGRGGHFAAFEQPELFVSELRRWKRRLAGR